MKRRLPILMLTWLALSGCEPRGTGGETTGVTPVSQERARTLFLEHCAICHGERGDGRGVRRSSLHDKPPDFRRAAWRRGKTAEALRHTIREGVPGGDMPAWKLQLDDAQIAGLAEYVLTLAGPR